MTSKTEKKRLLILSLDELCWELLIYTCHVFSIPVTRWSRQTNLLFDKLCNNVSGMHIYGDESCDDVPMKTRQIPTDQSSKRIQSLFMQTTKDKTDRHTHIWHTKIHNLVNESNMLSPQSWWAQILVMHDSGHGLPLDSCPCLCTTWAGRWSTPPAENHRCESLIHSETHTSNLT